MYRVLELTTAQNNREGEREGEEGDEYEIATVITHVVFRSCRGRRVFYDGFKSECQKHSEPARKMGGNGRDGLFSSLLLLKGVKCDRG